MRILLTGASGMFGHAAIKKWSPNHQVFSVSRNKPKFDTSHFTADLTDVDFLKVLEWSKPDVIVHAGASVDLKFCEENPDTAYKVNVEATKRILKSAETFNHKIKFFFLSTEAVYSPKKFPHLYSENDSRESQSIYGKTKIEAENHVLGSSLEHSVLRSTLVGYPGHFGKLSFVEWLIKSIGERQIIPLFTNSFFTPITANQLSDLIEYFFTNKMAPVLNVGVQRSITKEFFGLELARRLGVSLDRFKSVECTDASRNLNQAMDNSKLKLVSAELVPSIDHMFSDLVLSIRNEGFKYGN